MPKNRVLSSGDLKHNVTVYAPAGVLDDDAVNVDAGVPAKIEVLPPAFQARESLALGGPRTQTLYNVTVRYREDLKASFVLNEECHTQRAFQILSVVPSDRGDFVEMTCVTNG